MGHPSHRAIRRFAALSALAAAFPAAADYAINLAPPASDIARDIYHLHTTVLWVCFGIFLVVFLPMFYALWNHRKSKGHVAHSFHENSRLEMLWTALPVVILVGLAIPTTKVVLAMKDVGQSDMSIKVTGRQWKWEYDYLGQGYKFVSSLATPQDQISDGAPKDAHYLLEVDHPLVVPTGRKIRLVFTAEDVIHSWWVPAFGVKQDAIPGFIRDAWVKVDEPGVYRGQCAELCGVGHAFMPIVVQAVPPAEFAAWIEARKKEQAAAAGNAPSELSLPELIARGQKVFLANCAVCHQANGAGVPGTFPALDGSPIVNGPKEAHLNRVFNGKTGTAMPAFGKQLSDVDIAAVISFERNSWHNKTGDAVQPHEVAALRASAGK